MKKLAIFLIFSAMAALVSCSGAGSGNMLTQMRTEPEFNEILATGIQYLNIHQGDKYQIKVTADDNVINSVFTVSREGALHIYTRKQLKNTDITVDIVMPTIKRMELSGSIETSITGAFSVYDFDIKTSGSSNIMAENIVSEGKVTILSDGSGNVTLSGSSLALKLRSEGSGNIFTDNFDSEEISARIYGTGNIFVKSNGKLSVGITGTGNLIYSGEPQQLRKQITGTGSVQQRK